MIPISGMPIAAGTFAGVTVALPPGNPSPPPQALAPMQRTDGTMPAVHYDA